MAPRRGAPRSARGKAVARKALAHKAPHRGKPASKRPALSSAAQRKLERPPLKKPAAAGGAAKRPADTPDAARRSLPAIAAPVAAPMATVPTTVIPAVRVVDGVAAPTAEWRRVPPGVPCPRACEFRMDLSTGQNIVRLSAPIRPAPTCTTLALRPASPPAVAPSTASFRASSAAPMGSAVGPQAAKGAAWQPLSLLLRNRMPQLAPSNVQPPNSLARVASQPSAGGGNASGVKPGFARAASQLSLRSGSSGLRRASGSSGSVGTPPVERALAARVGDASGVKTVQRERRCHHVKENTDGSREEARIDVRSLAVARPDGAGETRVARRDERVHRLRNGRTVVTETITLKKITILP